MNVRSVQLRVEWKEHSKAWVAEQHLDVQLGNKETLNSNRRGMGVPAWWYHYLKKAKENLQTCITICIGIGTLGRTCNAGRKEKQGNSGTNCCRQNYTVRQDYKQEKDRSWAQRRAERGSPHPPSSCNVVQTRVLDEPKLRSQPSTTSNNCWILLSKPLKKSARVKRTTVRDVRLSFSPIEYTACSKTPSSL